MKNMKKNIFLALALTMISLTSTGQDDQPINSGFGFGGQVVQFQRDFGIGLNLTSPYFANDGMAVRLKANFMFHEHVQNLITTTTTTWTPYQNISLGIVGVGGKIGDYIRLYGEGGAIVLLPSSTFSSTDVEMGGYGVFGFEFFMDRCVNYYIEIGGVGTGAVADKVANEPIYSNGLIINVGFRFSLK